MKAQPQFLRDIAALELCGYVIGMLQAGAISPVHNDCLKDRIKSLRDAYGLDPISILTKERTNA